MHYFGANQVSLYDMSVDYPAILQHQTTSIIVLDELLRVRYCNEAAEALLTSSLKRLAGQRIRHLLSGDTELIGACESVLDRGQELRLRQHRLSLPGADSPKQVSCTISRIGSGAEPGEEFEVMLEISEIEVAGTVLRDEDFVSRQQSNQAVIRGLAHEIRNPLGGIRGAAQLLAQEAANDALDEYTSIIIREADRLTALVDRMQAKTRADLDQEINIHRLLEHVRQLILADNPTGLRIVQDYDPSLPAVRGNSDLLIQALLNVLRNAADAVAERQSGPEGGEIRLRTRIDHLAAEGQRHQAVRIDVIDNGPGIAADIEHQIFDPMVTGKASGTGLGLPITAEIITQHEGALDYTSRPGETTFRLFLPVAEVAMQFPATELTA